MIRPTPLQPDDPSGGHRVGRGHDLLGVGGPTLALGDGGGGLVTSDQRLGTVG